MGVTVKQWKGAWWIFVNHHGQRKAKRVGTGNDGKKAAKAAATKIQGRLASGEPLREQPSATTLAAYAASWLKSYAAVECKPRTHELYESMLRVHILPTLGTSPLTDLKRDQIRDLLAAKAETGLKRGTLRNILAPLRELLNHAVEDGVMVANPAARIGRRLARMQAHEEQKRVEIFTEPDLAHLLATAEAQYPEATDLIATLAWTGLREGEAFGLQWPDVDFHNGFLEVRRTVAYRKQVLQVGSPKSKKSRRVDLPTVLLAKLRERHDKAKEDAALMERAFIPWVFPNGVGLPRDASNFSNRLWYPLLEAAGLHRVPPHTLRHTYASLLIMRGENLVYIKEQLGHSSIQVTVDLYGHLIPGVHRGAVDALAEATKCNPRATEAGAELTSDVEVLDLIGGPTRT